MMTVDYIQHQRDPCTHTDGGVGNCVGTGISLTIVVRWYTYAVCDIRLDPFVVLPQRQSQSHHRPKAGTNFTESPLKE